MERIEIGFLGIAILLGLIGIRVPIGAAMGSTAFVGIWAMMGWKPAVGIVKAVRHLHLTAAKAARAAAAAAARQVRGRARLSQQ